MPPASRTAVEELGDWAASMRGPGTELLDTEGWQFARLDPDRARRAAVLILLGRQDVPRVGPGGEREALTVLFVLRAGGLSAHPGQVAFPGGAIDEDDADEVAAALREAQEETGLDPDGVEILGSLPEVGLPVSNFLVTPVLGWWARPSQVRVVDTGESELVFQVPVTTLLDPAHRRTAVVHRDGRTSRTPAFLTPDAVIWGFTAMLLDAMFDGLGWTRPWDRSLEIPAPL